MIHEMNENDGKTNQQRQSASENLAQPEGLGRLEKR
jgi:hypothetical protein